VKVTHNYSQFSSTKKTIVTIGTFDGVHIGHQKIISQLLYASKKENETSVLLTFFPHPRMVLQKDSNIKLINTIDEKINLLENLGLEELIIHPFNRDFSRLTALEFVRDILVKIEKGISNNFWNMERCSTFKWKKFQRRTLMTFL
jgi:riboflavin kinase/FMN adenylyltransferase